MSCRLGSFIPTYQSVGSMRLMLVALAVAIISPSPKVMIDFFIFNVFIRVSIYCHCASEQPSASFDARVPSRGTYLDIVSVFAIPVLRSFLACTGLPMLVPRWGTAEHHKDCLLETPQQGSCTFHPVGALPSPTRTAYSKCLSKALAHFIPLGHCRASQGPLTRNASARLLRISSR